MAEHRNERKTEKMLPAESAMSCQRSLPICESNCWSVSIFAAPYLRTKVQSKRKQDQARGRGAMAAAPR